MVLIAEGKNFSNKSHKRIEKTVKYTQLVQFEDDESDAATAPTVEEAKELLAVGFNHLTEKEGFRIFRKPKRFNG